MCIYTCNAVNSAGGVVEDVEFTVLGKQSTDYRKHFEPPRLLQNTKRLLATLIAFSPLIRQKIIGRDSQTQCS